MDDALLAELDDSLSNVGTSESWVRTIGGRTVMLSPISYAGQCKVQEALTNQALGVNSSFESKRVVLAYAIVGISSKNGIMLDLTPFRKSKNPEFPIYDHRIQKNVRVDLPTYIHNKMMEWGEPWINATFDVFVDLMETHNRENVKDVKFENAKNPLVELSELEERVRDLRERLGKPPLVEQAESDTEDSPIQNSGEEVAPVKEVDPNDSPLPFNPFQQVKNVGPAPSPPQPVAPPPAPPFVPTPPPVMTVPIPVPPHLRERVQNFASLDDGLFPSPPSASAAAPPPVVSPGKDDDVIEKQAAKVLATPPVMDGPKQSVNPKFDPRYSTRPR